MLQDINQLDSYLEEVLNFYDKFKDRLNVGLVAAGLFYPDPENHPIIAVSRKHSDTGLWVHAERRAIEKHISKYGINFDSAVLITTLSPCTTRNSKTRLGSSCLEFIRLCKIKQIHIGCKDLSQPEYPENLDIDISYTVDRILQRRCESLYRKVRGFH